MRPLPPAVDCIGTAQQRSVDAASLWAVARPFGSYRSDFSCQNHVLAVFWPCFDDFDRLICQHARVFIWRAPRAFCTCIEYNNLCKFQIPGSSHLEVSAL